VLVNERAGQPQDPRAWRNCEMVSVFGEAIAQCRKNTQCRGFYRLSGFKL